MKSKFELSVIISIPFVKNNERQKYFNQFSNFFYTYSAYPNPCPLSYRPSLAHFTHLFRSRCALKPFAKKFSSSYLLHSFPRNFLAGVCMYLKRAFPKAQFFDILSGLYGYYSFIQGYYFTVGCNISKSAQKMAIYLFYWMSSKVVLTLWNNFSLFEFWRQKCSPYQKEICHSLLDS